MTTTGDFHETSELRPSERAESKDVHKDRNSGVVITGVDIPFGDLVRLYVKMALAAIPALLILALLAFVLVALVTGV